MTHHDYNYLHQLRYRWQKEQQLARKKYQIPYNMIYSFTQCSTKSLFNTKKTIITDDNQKTKNFRLDNLNVPPMYCSKCYLYITECSCINGLGQWWKNLQTKSRSTDKISKLSSINSLHDRHVNFDSNSIDFSSSDEKKYEKLNSNKQHYAILNWNNRQSLLNFLQTVKPNQKFSTMTIEQLHEFINNNDHIHIFNSINELIYFINKENRFQTLFHQIYIDSSQSQLIADNLNLDHTLYSIKKIARLLGVKIDELSQEKSLTKHRKSLLNHQISFIASKLPYNTFRTTSTHTQ
ncbi:unnamed protein product [Adineta steineri]|uniref:HTH cro/C1-type domain-containing protein n=1 Tax=Adineta steineri TaxID=433720 RepID=A0A818JH45_9BILA|nr:unnamed protein product [Adineta steineri]CAF1064681.1 unnamed protein product [Adineta steineri]CAF3544039.1 unnamed protein product [Adineta steineri]CAF3552800.1 unnamed protein product [Adineta steineri]CAF3955541.1 unnamed protein product [Adineta steineri]